MCTKGRMMIKYTGITNSPMLNANISNWTRYASRLFRRNHRRLPTLYDNSSNPVLRWAVVIMFVCAGLAYTEDRARYVSDGIQQPSLEEVIKQHDAKIRAARLKEVEETKREAYVEYINKNYHISKQAASVVLDSVDNAVAKFNIPKNLILAVIAKESGFNPFAGSVANAEGLMQMITKWHPDEMKAIGGSNHVIEAQGSVLSGTQALKEYIESCNGNTVCGLQKYNGNRSDRHTLYAVRVLKERKNLEDWIRDRT